MKKTLNIVIALLVTNCLIAGGLWYGYTTMLTQKENEGKLRKDIAAEDKRTQQLASLRRTLTLVQSQREALEKNLINPTDENQIALISKLEQLGVPTGAKVIVRSLDLSGSPRALRGSLAVTGSWSEVYHVLALLEAYPARIVINRFSLSGSISAKGAEQWTCDITFDVLNVKP